MFFTKGSFLSDLAFIMTKAMTGIKCFVFDICDDCADKHKCEYYKKNRGGNDD